MNNDNKQVPAASPNQSTSIGRHPKVDPSQIYPTARPPSARLGAASDYNFTPLQPRFKLTPQRIKYILITLLVLTMFVTFFTRNDYRGVEGLSPEILTEPLQTSTASTPFPLKYEDANFTVTPRFEYELNGLVVSRKDYDHLPAPEGVFDHKVVQSDLCVLWGENIRSGNYKKVRPIYTQDGAPGGTRFCTVGVYWGEQPDFTAVSNNHLMFIDPAIKAKYEGVKKGDQVKLVGKLVDLKQDVVEGSRRWTRHWRTSTVRTDMGMQEGGACEIILVEDVVILNKNRNISQLIFKLSVVILAGLILARIYTGVRRAVKHKKIT